MRTGGSLTKVTSISNQRVVVVASMAVTLYAYPQSLGMASMPASVQGVSFVALPDIQVSRKSKFRGVTWDRRDRRWRVRMNCLGVQHHVGR